MYSESMNDVVSQKIETFFGQYRVRKYGKGQVLILDGDTVDEVYHLVSGKVKQYDVNYRGDEMILNIFKHPAFFPMAYAINKMPSRYIFEAESELELHSVPVAEVMSFLESNPDVVIDLLGRVYLGIEGVLGRLTHVIGSSAKERMLYELVIEVRRFGVIDEQGACAIGIHEKDLAARAGLSRETVSREMHALRTSGIIELTSKGIVVFDTAELEKMAHMTTS